MNPKTISSREWRSENPARDREISREAQARRRLLAPDKVRETNRLYRERNRFKVRARSLVGKRIQRGALMRPDACMDCGVECKPHAHHDDYRRPLEVRWLCSDCHWKRHPGPLQQATRPAPALVPTALTAGRSRFTATNT